VRGVERHLNWVIVEKRILRYAKVFVDLEEVRGQVRMFVDLGMMLDPVRMFVVCATVLPVHSIFDCVRAVRTVV
jgi:hypothetical protein